MAWPQLRYLLHLLYNPGNKLADMQINLALLSKLQRVSVAV